MNFSFWPLMIYLLLVSSTGWAMPAWRPGCRCWPIPPTLILPPLGERLALRYRAEAVIPAGLFAIGAGAS